MSAFDLFLIAAWVWFCLVFIPGRVMQSALFLIPVLLIGLTGTLCEYICKRLTETIHATGEW